MSGKMSSGWTLAEMPSQTGKRIFITGANSGVGYAAAVELARRGAAVVMACRDRTRGEEALRALRAEAVGPESAAEKAELVLLDLASLASVRKVAEAEVARHQPLHCLINNAGVMRPAKRRLTEDGFELQFGTNVLGHFALTCLLMPALEMARASQVEDSPRIVTVSSIAHLRGQIHFDDLQSAKSYWPTRAYAQSKLANLMFTFALERRLRTATMGSVSIGVHPGVAESNLFKLDATGNWARLAERTIHRCIAMFLNTRLGGAIPTLYAATAPEAEGGAYYGPQEFFEMRGGDVGPAQVSKAAQDVAVQERFWAVCEELTGCRF
jgi:NAD(P)-dependent dehydrogenase (short-subunit alcohol dehydrogenase family)